MKKIITKTSLIFVAIAVVFFFIKGNFNKQEVKLNPDVLGLPTSQENSVIDILYKEKNYRVNWYEIENIDNLFLSVNSKRLTSQELISENKCIFLSSGGYYKSNYSPTGLLISEYKEVSPFVTSSLANGIFSVNDFATPRITSVIPRDRLRMALQVGPLLKENGEFIKLSLRNDEEARRMVLGVTGENKAIFLVLYNINSVFQGPYLKDLPDILDIFEKETGIIFADILNLDGGTPTVFSNNEVNLTESTIVGNYFCLR